MQLLGDGHETAQLTELEHQSRFYINLCAN